jgi:hypothetical protein
MVRLRFTRDSVCLADDVNAPHEGILEVDGTADAVAVAQAVLRSGLLSYTTNAVWSLSLGVDRVVFGRGWIRSFAWPVTLGELRIRAQDVEAVHARYWAQARPADILTRLAASG